MNKVYGGTPGEHDHSQCRSCRWAQIMRGPADSSERVICRSLSPQMVVIKQPIISCNSYDDKSHPSIYQMQDIAWTVENKGEKRGMGFVSPDERKHRASQPTPPIPGLI